MSKEQLPSVPERPSNNVERREGEPEQVLFEEARLNELLTTKDIYFIGPYRIGVMSPRPGLADEVQTLASQKYKIKDYYTTGMLYGLHSNEVEVYVSALDSKGFRKIEKYYRVLIHDFVPKRKQQEEKEHGFERRLEVAFLEAQNYAEDRLGIRQRLDSFLSEKREEFKAREQAYQELKAEGVIDDVPEIPPTSSDA